MARFYTKSWFPYILPFLLCFVLAQASAYLPKWALHISTLQIFVGGGLIWVWRHIYSAGSSTQLTRRQFLISIFFGILGFAIWVTCQHYKLISQAPGNIPTQWPLTLRIAISTILIAGSSLIMPAISEIFWRSFMLRYLIVQDFKSIPLGEFQLFSFIGVVVLSAIPSEYTVAVAAIGVIQNILIIWQKNLGCCIVSSITTNTMLALFLLSNNYRLM